MNFRHLCTAVGAAILLCGISIPAQAQCAANEVLVGEDKDFYYCKDREEYAACIRTAGKTLEWDLAACVSDGQACLGSKAPQLKGATLACVLSCMRTGIPSACLGTCGATVIVGAELLGSCDTALTLCREKSLRDDKARREDCKK